MATATAVINGKKEADRETGQESVENAAATHAAEVSDSNHSVSDEGRLIQKEDFAQSV